MVDSVTGRVERHDPVLPGKGGPAGNARLTAWIGLVMLVLIAAELVTLFDVRGLISWHIAVGTLLLPPALAKTASTGYRLARYYTGDPHYREAGPPPLVLRLLGPLVVVSTLALLASGVALVLLGQSTSQTQLLSLFGIHVNWVTIHQASFAGWAVVTGVHVLARLMPALRLTVTGGSRAHVPGSAWRAAAIALAAVIAILAAILLVQADSSWGGQPDRRPGHESTSAPGAATQRIGPGHDSTSATAAATQRIGPGHDSTSATAAAGRRVRPRAPYPD